MHVVSEINILFYCGRSFILIYWHVVCEACMKTFEVMAVAGKCVPSNEREDGSPMESHRAGLLT